jgi:hypothetical protein
MTLQLVHVTSHYTGLGNKIIWYWMQSVLSIHAITFITSYIKSYSEFSGKNLNNINL